MWFLFIRVMLIWFVTTFVALTATAQDSKNLTVDGERGRWFPLSTAGLLLEEHLKVPELQKLVDSQAALIETLNERGGHLSMSLTACSDAVLHARGLAEESKQALQTAEISINAADDEIYILNTKLRAWYRHPVVWTGVGMVLGGVTVVYISRRN